MDLSLATKPCRLGEGDRDSLLVGLLDLFWTKPELSRRRTNPICEGDPSESTLSHLHLSELLEIPVESSNLEVL